MKKSVGLKLAMIGFLALVLGGCGKSAQDVFIEDLTSISSQKDYNAADFSMKFNKVDINYQTGDEKTDAIIAMAGSQLEDAKLSGSYILDAKNNAMDYKLKVEAMGQEVPLNFQMSKDGFYYSCDSFTKIVDIVQSVSGNTSVDLSSVEDQLKGKYLMLDKEDLKAYSADLSDLTKQKGDTILTDYTKTLDKNSFKKDGDVYSHTFDKNEMLALIKYAKKNGNEDTKKALKEIDSSALDETKDMDKLSLKVSVNDKTKKVDYQVSVKLSDDKGSVDLVMTLSDKVKKTKESVQTPAKEQTVTLDALEGMISDSAKYVVSDEDFESIYSSLKDMTSYYTKDQVAEMLKSYSFTDEQQAKIDALFPK